MTRREQINRGRLRAQIKIDAMADGTVCIFCPAEVSQRLYEYLRAMQFVSSHPRPAIFARYRDDQLIVTVVSEVDKFVASLPEPCYERDIPSSDIPPVHVQAASPDDSKQNL